MRGSRLESKRGSRAGTYAIDGEPGSNFVVSPVRVTWASTRFIIWRPFSDEDEIAAFIGASHFDG